MSAWVETAVDQGVADVAAYLIATFAGSRPLEPEELARYRQREPICGWRIPTTLHMPEVDVLLLRDFPYALPRIALVDHNKDIPHSEHDGVLCLEQDGATFDHTRPADVVDQELARAATLFSEIQNGQHQVDFTRDFERYWIHYATQSVSDVVSLVESVATGCHLRAARYVNPLTRKSIAVISDPPERGTRWLKNLLGPNAPTVTGPVVLCPVSPAPIPSQYPASGKALLTYLVTACPTGANLLLEVVGAWPAEVLVMLCVDRAPKPLGFGVMRLVATLRRSQGKKRRQRAARGSGNTLAREWLDTARIERLRVHRAEPAWMHGRYTNGYLATLNTKKIAVIGAGSLGARVAQLLAQAGVANIALIDPDAFELANSSRHVLGAGVAGHKKADALAAMLRRALPHHDGIVSYPTTWQQQFRIKPEALTGVDLILSLTGDWNADAALNDLQHSPTAMPPVIYGWVEPMAYAAHAVLLKSTGPCLRCHFTASGAADRRVTAWPEAIETVAMCGAIHTPFGSAELSLLRQWWLPWPWTLC